MIPRKIHYCWFGPKRGDDFSNNWRQIHPRWEISLWTEKVINKHCLPGMNSKEEDYIFNALERHSYATASNLARLIILSIEGGIYLDTDMELLKPIGKFLDNSCFLGRTCEEWLNNAVIGATHRHPFIRHLIDATLFSFDGSEHPLAAARLLTPLAMSKYANDVKIYEPEVFYPIHYRDGGKPTANSYAVHHCAKRW